jgi:NADH-quinone oxidoreductase subunit L
MATPLVILGFLALVGGVINLPWGKANFLTRWLEPVFPKQLAPEPHVDTAIKVILAVATVALGLVGIGLGLVPWLRSTRHDALEPVVLRHAWYGDEAVAAFVAGPGTELADFTAYDVDQDTIDGAVNGVAWLVRHGGGVLRKLQTGYVRNYALGVAGGAAALLLYVVVRTGR